MDGFKKILFLFIFFVVLIKFVILPYMNDSMHYRGFTFRVDVPAGWKKYKDENFKKEPDTEILVLVPDLPADENLDFEALKTGKPPEPKTKIIFTSRKLPNPMWIEDEFPQILETIAKFGNTIMDKGEIKINNQLFKWVIFNNRKGDKLSLNFYAITDNARIYTVELLTPPAEFNKYRPGFEKAKGSLKF